MKKQKIVSSQNRVIMTDVLPFEVPLNFSNIGLFNFLLSNNNAKPNFIKFLFENKDFYIPYKYDIKRKSDKYRTLSLVHPIAQIKFVEFYSRFEALILYNCNKSNYSLRRPVKKTQQKKSEGNKYPLFPMRHFVYGPYNFMYEFFDSFEFRRLEKKYTKLSRVDISKCFDSIYTHSISWAIKDKGFSKKNINKISFEHEFDRIMQFSNYNETNGIVIGPEFSRLFAEVILQDVDIQIEKKLLKNNLSYNKEYVIRRYVDDYHVYAHSKETIDFIIAAIETELKNFNLFLNESKTNHSSAPFISNISLAKIQISTKINIFFEKLFKYEAEFANKYKVRTLKKIKRPSALSNQILNDIKSVLLISSVSIADISKFTLSVINNKLERTITYKEDEEEAELTEEEQQKFIVFITIIIDLIFSIISLNIVPKNTIYLIDFITNIQYFCMKKKIAKYQFVQKRILDETLFLFSSLNHKNKEGCVESSNILTAISLLGANSLLPVKYLIINFNIYKNTELNYFKFTGLLYYIKDNRKYDEIRNILCVSVLDKFKQHVNPMNYSEMFILFFDYIKCPHIKKRYKIELINIVKEKHNFGNITDSEMNRIIKYVNRFSWFTQWGTSIKQLLKLKEYAIDY